MTQHRKTKSLRRALIAPVAIIGLATSSLTALVSGAVFTDSSVSASNVLTTGTIDIASSPASGSLTISNMMPGDSVTAPITITNSGSDPLRYALTTTTTNTDAKNLATNLTTNIKVGVTTCTTAGFGASGTAVVGPLNLDTLDFGNSAQGAQAGDRTLANGASEVLCIQATLPLAAANTLQNATTTATLTFNAEQTKNN